MLKNKIFNITSTFVTEKSADNSALTIRGMASTSHPDRVGDVIDLEAWTKGGLDNFANNPIILFNHNHDRPIGRATKISPLINGLEMEATISKAAGEVYDLVKDGVLGAFSVGFRIKDADYLEETGGLKVKDAELFEVSVVSVPCNQAATFSLAKSFDSEEEYRDYVKNFSNSANLAGQSMAKGEENSSNVASDAPESDDSITKSETIMDEAKMAEIARKAAEEAAKATAASIAMKAAEEKAAEKAAKEAEEKAAEEKAAAEAAAKEVVIKSVESGTEKLIKDFTAKLADQESKFDSVISEFKNELEAKSAELEQMRESKRVFAANAGDTRKAIADNGKELMYASVYNTLTNKGWTDGYSAQVLEKAGIEYTANAPDIDQEVSNQIEKEIMLNLRVASLFREIQVNGQATVLPIQMDTGLAEWAGSAPAGNLENRDNATADTYEPYQKILNAYRLVSTTLMNNEVDEQVLINLMPMLVESVARSHARTVERSILNGNGAGIAGLDGEATASTSTLSIGGGDLLTADLLLGMRQQMGKYGMAPAELAYIVSQQGYYDLLSDPKFQTLDEVGSDLAVRVTGAIGAVYGTPVVPSDEFIETPAAGVPAAFCVNTRNYVIPRLRGVMVEQDYEVREQRRVIVASQNLGFEEILPGNAVNKPSVKLDYAV